MAGNETLNWEYGQKNLKHIFLNHALGLVSKSNYSDSLNLGPSLEVVMAIHLVQQVVI